MTAPRKPGEPEAAWMRRTGQLWPQTLSTAELRAELDRVDPKANPISARMLREEEAARRGK